MAGFADHDAYIDAAPEPLQPLLAHLRDVLARALPDAQEIIRYDMPGFSLAGSVIVGYGAFSKQCGLYADKQAIAAHADELVAAGLKPTKTGVKFAPGKPIPDQLVTSIADAARRAVAG